MGLRIRCVPVAIAGDAFAGPATVNVDDSFLQLDRLELIVTRDSYTSFRLPVAPSYRVTAGDYLHGDAKMWRDRSLLCPEMPLSRHLTPAIRLDVSAPVWSARAVAFVHAGRQGCIAPLHYDWDHTWVAHACVTGRKRVFLFPPQAGWLLSPIINTSALCVPRLLGSDLQELVSGLGGLEVTLEAGQGVLFPSLFWHGVLYEEASVSISVRFEQRPGGRPFAVLPRSWWLQRLVWRFFQQGYDHRASAFLSEYLDSFFATGSWEERYRRTTALCRRVLRESGERHGADEWVAENFSAERVLATLELKLGYGSAPKNAPGKDDMLMKTLEYIFKEIASVPRASKRLAAYALKVRQGLPPVRGLVEIAHN